LSFERLQAIVERVVRSSLRKDDAAADVRQDAFVQILRGLSTVRDPDRLEAWVARVTVFTVTREQRRRRRSIRALSVHDQEAASTLVTLPKAEDGELLVSLEAALSRLGPADRQLLFERASSRTSLQARAAALGCSLSTLKRRLKRARNRLSRIMEHDADLLPLRRTLTQRWAGTVSTTATD
jgi:RNA polymerase sigma-70 factor (ECF subfamily)